MAASIAHAAAINPNGIKRILVNDLSIFLIKSPPFFSIGPKSLPTNHADWPILCN